MMSLGISGVASIFRPLYSLVLAPLPLPQPQQLVHLGGRVPVFNVYTNTLMEPERFAPFFAHFAVYAPIGGVLSQWRFRGQDRVTEVNAVAVTPDFFGTVDIRPQLGRDLGSEGMKAQVVVISHRLWRSQFSQADDIVGSTVDVGGTARQIVGIMPKEFAFPGDVDAWLPIASATYASDGLETIARLRDHITPRQAADSIGAMGRKLTGGVSGEFGAAGAIVEPFQRYLMSDTRSTLWTLLAIAGLFLSLACVGIVNLLLAQGVRRREEMMIRSALGASRRTLVAQLLVETSLLVGTAALAGFWISRVVGGWLMHLFLKIPTAASLTWPVAALICTLVILITLVAGVAPSLYVTRADAMGLTGRIAERFSNSGRFPIRDVLVATQLTLALALLIGTGLLARSLRAQVDAPTGFQATGIVTFRMILPPTSARLAERDAAAAARSRPSRFPATQAEMVRNRLFFREFTAAIAALPSVTNVGALHPVPFTPFASQTAKVFTWATTRNTLAGVEDPDAVRVMLGAVDRNGFDVLHVPLVEGRRFTEGDVDAMYARQLARRQSTSPPVAPTPVLINRALARHWWPSDSAIGKHFSAGSLQPFVVVGVVGDYQWTPSTSKDRFALFEPFTGATGISVVASVARDTDVRRLSEEIDRAARSLMVDVPPVRLDRLDAIVIAGQRDLRTALFLLGGFAALSVAVASFGVHTSVMILVASRAREMGIRMALGATRHSIRMHLVGRVVRLLMALPFGWALGWGIARLLSHLLVGVAINDFATYAVATGGVVAALGLAAAVPLWRAGAADPAAVLRTDWS